MQEAIARARDLRISPQKARLVADQVRGLRVDKAIELLTFSPKKAAGLVKKIIVAAIANAQHNKGLDIDNLSLTQIRVDEAPRLKRFMARAKGRGNRIVKRNSHITVVVGEKAHKPKTQTKKRNQKIAKSKSKTKLNDKIKTTQKMNTEANAQDTKIKASQSGVTTTSQQLTGKE